MYILQVAAGCDGLVIAGELGWPSDCGPNGLTHHFMCCAILYIYILYWWVYGLAMKFRWLHDGTFFFSKVSMVDIWKSDAVLGLDCALSLRWWRAWCPAFVPTCCLASWTVSTIFVPRKTGRVSTVHPIILDMYLLYIATHPVRQFSRCHADLGSVGAEKPSFAAMQSFRPVARGACGPVENLSKHPGHGGCWVIENSRSFLLFGDVDQDGNLSFWAHRPVKLCRPFSFGNHCAWYVSRRASQFSTYRTALISNSTFCPNLSQWLSRMICPNLSQWLSQISQWYNFPSIFQDSPNSVPLLPRISQEYPKNIAGAHRALCQVRSLAVSWQAVETWSVLVFISPNGLLNRETGDKYHGIF